MFIKYPFVFSWNQNQAWSCHGATQYRCGAERCWTMQSAKGCGSRCGAGRNLKLFSTPIAVYMLQYSRFQLSSAQVEFYSCFCCHHNVMPVSSPRLPFSLIWAIIKSIGAALSRRSNLLAEAPEGKALSLTKYACLDLFLLDIHTRVGFVLSKKETTGLGLQRSPEIWLFSCVPVSARQC